MHMIHCKKIIDKQTYKNRIDSTRQNFSSSCSKLEVVPLKIILEKNSCKIGFLKSVNFTFFEN